MQSVRYCCPILTKFGVPRQIFVKVLSTKFQENPPSRNRAETCRETDGGTDRRTDRQPEGQAGRGTGRRTDRQPEGQAGGGTDRRRDRQADGQMGGGTDKCEAVSMVFPLSTRKRLKLTY